MSFSQAIRIYKIATEFWQYIITLINVIDKVKDKTTGEQRKEIAVTLLKEAIEDANRIVDDIIASEG